MGGEEKRIREKETGVGGGKDLRKSGMAGKGFRWEVVVLGKKRAM